MKFITRLSLVAAVMAFVAPSTGASSLEFLPTADLDKAAAVVETPKASDTWTPGVCVRDFPKELINDFPYYLLGYNFQGRPVVLAEMGSWRVRKWAEYNETSRRMVRDFMENFWCRLHNLTSPIEGADSNDGGVMLINDCESFSASELGSLEGIKVQLFYSRLGEKTEASIVDFWMIRSNFATTAWVDLVRPVAGRLFGRLESKGFRQETYLAALRSQMDASIIPPWLGGTGGKDWKPLKVWG